jgi:hypothetical protein
MIQKEMNGLIERQDTLIKKQRMTERKNRKTCLVYPEDKFKNIWDLFMTVVLLVTCISTPLDIAFAAES